MMYMEGSINFIVGAVFGMARMQVEADFMEEALVTLPYFIGSVAFTIGSYAGLLEVLNVGKRPDDHSSRMTLCWTSRQQWRQMRQYLSWEPIIGYVCYVVGALAFNVNTLGGLCGVENKMVVWGAATLGSILFSVGGALESYHNKLHLNILGIPRTLAQALSWFNTVGALLYLIASLCGFFQLTDVEEIWLIDFVYLLGSLAFAAGGLISLWMWKSESYGLGLISEMNVPRLEEGNEHEVVLSMHSQYGCGRSSAWQLPWLVMYIINATASVLDISLCFHLEPDVHRIVNSICGFALSHGILLLGSVIHHIPTAAPHSWLLIYMRCVLFFSTMNSIYGVHLEIAAVHANVAGS